MPKLLLFIICCGLVFPLKAQNRYRFALKKADSNTMEIFPKTLNDKPSEYSPLLTEQNRELVLVSFTNGLYAWMDATVENGAPFDYKKQLFGKGNQLQADGIDFPYLAQNRIHDESELRDTKTISGRSVSQITVDGRPWGSSGVGFMAEDETIMSVIYGDNQTVKKLGLTHCDIARPLFHLWNCSREISNYNDNPQLNEVLQISALQYNGKVINCKITGSRGWQESIFNDEILGTGHIEIWRQLTLQEKAFLAREYRILTAKQMEELEKMLSYFHTGEMVFFYINRYGFYEGHVEYRADPVTVALIFGLTSLETAHRVCSGDLYRYFNSHFTTNP